jgi:hypothetical protein
VVECVGCEVAVAGQLFKRLETEGGRFIQPKLPPTLFLIDYFLGFIAVETIVTDEHGLLSTRTRPIKNRGKAKGKAKTRKELQKAKYYFVKSSKTTTAYLDYFNPDADVEKRMMGLSEAVSVC